MKFLIGKQVRTIDGHSGIVIKHYKVTGSGMSVHIKQDDGRIWYCPEESIIKIQNAKEKTIATSILLKQISKGVQEATETIIKESKLEAISGYTIEQLTKMFLAGWELKPPQYDEKLIKQKLSEQNNADITSYPND